MGTLHRVLARNRRSHSIPRTVSVKKAEASTRSFRASRDLPLGASLPWGTAGTSCNSACRMPGRPATCLPWLQPTTPGPSSFRHPWDAYQRSEALKMREIFRQNTKCFASTQPHRPQSDLPRPFFQTGGDFFFVRDRDDRIDNPESRQNDMRRKCQQTHKGLCSEDSPGLWRCHQYRNLSG